MDESATLLTLFYLVMVICFVLKSNEFISAGLTVESLLYKFIGTEADNFIFYHIKRSSYTLLIHSSLLLGYRLSLSWVSDYPFFDSSFTILNIIGTIGLAVPITSAVIVFRWKKNNWEEHPISRKLALFCDSNTSWRTLATDINIEFRRVDKITIKCSSLVEVLVTDNWIIKVTPYGIDLAHQSDTTLSVDTADTHVLASSASGPTQFLNIKAEFSRRGSHQFFIRLNALDFKELEQKLRRPVAIAQNIVFHRSRADQFLEVFREEVSKNPLYIRTEELEMCIGCMINSSNVKLVKHCVDEEHGTPCRNCYCRPMWCVDCMARWFASRQEEDHPEQWLSSKCTCPVCRSVFCILDISMIQDSLPS